MGKEDANKEIIRMPGKSTIRLLSNKQLIETFNGKGSDKAHTTATYNTRSH